MKPRFDFGTLLAFVMCALAFLFLMFAIAYAKAERLNRVYGTHFSAMDVLMGRSLGVDE